MAFDFAAAKTRTRRAVMKTLGVDALYSDDVTVVPVPIRARWHTKIERFGADGGYAEVIEGIERIVLSIDQARALNVKRNGVITFPTLGGQSVTLSAMEPKDGPVEEIWAVSSE